MGGQASGRHLTAGDALDQLLLSTLGVPGPQRLHSDVTLAAHQSTQVLDGILLVGLHTDHAALEAECLHEDAQAADNLLAVLQHESVVSGDVGLTLGAVEEHGVHLANTRADLHMGGEAGAAHTGKASLLHDVDDLIGAQLGVIGMGNELGAPGILEVVLDHHRHTLAAAHIGTGLHRLDLTGDRSVDGGTQTGDLADLLTHLDVIAHSNDGLTGSTDMHGHSDDHLLGSSAQRRYLLVACQLLPVMGMHAAVKALLHRSTSQI